MPDNTSTTSAAGGDTGPPVAPSSLVRPDELHNAVRWALRQHYDGDVEHTFDNVCHALKRGDGGCIKLALSSGRYRVSLAQSYLALEDIDPRGGQICIRTHHLLPRRFDPKYPAALRAFAAQHFPVVNYWETYEIEERLARLGIPLPPHLCDSGQCLPPFDLARALGMRFRFDVEEAEAAAILYRLDGKRCGFVISLDWIVTEIRLLQQHGTGSTVTVKHEPAPVTQKVVVDLKVGLGATGQTEAPADPEGDDSKGDPEVGSLRKLVVNRLWRDYHAGRYHAPGELYRHATKTVIPEERTKLRESHGVSVKTPVRRTVERWVELARRPKLKL